MTKRYDFPRPAGNMMRHVRSTPDVWAVAYVAKRSEREVQEFFVRRVGLIRDALKSNLHLTVYYARRALPGLLGHSEQINIEIDPKNCRFMPMAPGGENARADIEEGAYEIGVRIKPGVPERVKIEELRAKFYPYETPEVLGDRLPSNRTRNAFGARHFQPHITLLKSGCAMGQSLVEIGKEFRASISPIVLDRMVVKCRARPFIPR